jgi:ASPM-SPD-2-Hydin domain-containing protein
MPLPRAKPRRLLAFAVPAAAILIIVVMLPARMLAATSHLTCSPYSLYYAGVAIGRSETLLVTVTNSGPASVTISRVSVSNARFEVTDMTLPKILAAGESADVQVAFAPKETGWAGGSVTFTSNASNPTLSLTVGGSGVTSDEVTASPASVSFGDVPVGAHSTQTVVLTNTRTSSVTLTNVQTTSDQFSLVGAKFPLTLAGGQSVKLSATFTPQVVGLTGGSALVSGPTMTIPLEGTGLGLSMPQLAITPATLGFGNVAVGTTEKLTLGLKASGGSVTISSVSSSNSQFAVPGGVFPLTVPVGLELTLDVTFTPKSNGESSAALSFDSNAASSRFEALSGTGISPQVSLSWTASTSQVKGYNVYRKLSASSSYTKINSSLDPDTNYTDTAVARGATYYYATTAVNSSGTESAYSNPVAITIP